MTSPVVSARDPLRGRRTGDEPAGSDARGGDAVPPVDVREGQDQGSAVVIT